jgi:hypothetical protein
VTNSNDQRAHALFILHSLNIALGQDFHTLNASNVIDILEFADKAKYRKPKNANGSRARYYFNLLQRRARSLQN